MWAMIIDAVCKYTSCMRVDGCIWREHCCTVSYLVVLHLCLLVLIRFLDVVELLYCFQARQSLGIRQRQVCTNDSFTYCASLLSSRSTGIKGRLAMWAICFCILLHDCHGTRREGSASTSRDQIPPAGALLQRFSPRQPVESDSPRISALSARGEALPSFHTQTQLSHSYNNNENMCIPTLDLSNPLSNGHGYPVAHSLDTGMALNDPTNPTKPPRVKSAKKDKRAKKTIPKVN